MCLVNFVLPLSQLQSVEWGWYGRREPDDEHSPVSQGKRIASPSLFLLVVVLLWYILFVTQLGALLPFGGFPALKLLFCFSEFVIFRNLNNYMFFREWWDFLFFLSSLLYFGLACDNENSLLCLGE